MAAKHTWAIVFACCAARASATEAPIQSVTLYPGSATIERAIDVTPGMSTVEITGLLANFDTGTIRLQAPPGIQVGQVVTRDRSNADSPSPREAELDARIVALQDQIAAIDVDYKSAQTAQAYLEHLGGGDAGTRPAPADPKTLLGTVDAIRKGSGDALERMRGDEIRKRALARQLDALKRELGTVQASTRDSRSITVHLAVRQAGRLLLSYQVGRAGWKPTYRAALDSNASSVELQRLATISQKTGEDWSRVKLRLSTGQPSLSVYPPNPQSWLLNYQPPMDNALWVEKTPVRPLAAPAPAPAAPPAMSPRAAPDDYVAPILQTQGSFATEYEVPARVDLASDGREISVELARQVLPVRQRVLVAPRTSNTLAVLTAEAARPEGVWLPGQVQLQRDGSYVGAQYWDPQASEGFQFAFGRDPLVRVAVEHRGDKSGQAGLFNSERQRRVDDSYAVTNSHRQPIDILVLEPTPVSQSDRVAVKVALKPEPTVRDWEHRRGLVGWEQTLQPNQTARFEAGYVIDYPKEGAVFGLP